MRRAAIATSLLSLAAAGLLTGCPDRSIAEVNPLQGRVEYKDIPVNVNRKVDILFLIDDSPSMGDKQINLANNFPNFINVLSQIQGGLPDVHIGVATSDMGAKGAADSAPGPGIGTIGQGGCSGLGKNGDLQVFGASSLLSTGSKFIADTIQADGVTRTRNYSDPKGDGSGLAPAFAEMARAGFGGCGFEQHLEAVKQALDPNHLANAGFLRDDAYLAVIIIADEDDCSMSHSSLIATSENPLGPLQSFRCTRYGVICDQGGTTTTTMNQVGTKSQCHPSSDTTYLTDVAAYADALKKLKSDPSKVIVAGIIGAPDPFATELRPPSGSTTPIPALAHSCTYVGNDGKPEVADPPIRIKFFLDQFPNRSTFASICQKDLSGALQQIGDLLKTVLGDPCIEGKLADVDPNTAGPQYDCAVSTVRTDPTTMKQTETILPMCNPPDGSGATSVCWHLLADPANCQKDDPTSPHLALKIELQSSLPSDSHIIANCVTEVTNK
jgi:hypothetical protein